MKQLRQREVTLHSNRLTLHIAIDIELPAFLVILLASSLSLSLVTKSGDAAQQEPRKSLNAP